MAEGHAKYDLKALSGEPTAAGMQLVTPASQHKRGSEAATGWRQWNRYGKFGGRSTPQYLYI
tara:strand:- start:12 stop:197 length:186 start_codon:yes stop_codon:yes gene_type:complete